MRKGVSGMRRIAAVLSITTVALLVTGTGAGAVTAPKLVDFSAVGSGQVLNIDLQLPSALNALLQPAGLSNHITEAVSFSRSIGSVDRKVGNAGSGLGQMLDGTLNPVLETVTKTTLGKALPRVFATLGESLKTDSLQSIDVQDVLHLGVMEVSAVSKLQNAADGAQAVVSNSTSKLLGLKIDLGSQLTSTLTSVLQPVLDVTDKSGGLIDQINTGLQPVEDLVNQTLGTNLTLDLPKLAELLDRPLLSIGLIETGSDTGLAGLARTAQGVTRMANIDVFGTGDNALLHIDSLTSTAKASLGGSAPVADAVNKIVGLKVLGNSIDLTKDALTVGGKSFSLPIDSVVEPLTKLLADTLGLKIEVLSTSKKVTATSASAEANTLKIGLNPLDGALGLGLTVTGPNSTALVQASTVKGVKIPGPLPTTGVPTTAYFLAGPALLGLAVLVRRYSLAH
jgi:hypothetical protein